MSQKWKRFVMHVENRKRNCHNFLKNICGKRGQKGQNVKTKSKNKKEGNKDTEKYSRQAACRRKSGNKNRSNSSKKRKSGEKLWVL